MDLQIKPPTLHDQDKSRRNSMGKSETSTSFSIIFDLKERGEVIPLFVLMFMSMTLLLGSFSWLSKHLEKATKAEVKDFQKEWNILEKKYDQQ